jgi:hypothetical protein
VEKKNLHRILVGKPERSGPLEYLGAYDRITLKLIFGMWNNKASTRLIWFRISRSGGLLCTRL